MTQHITYTDRLQDRGFVDQWGFLLFAVLGFFAIILAKHLQVSVVWVSAGACAVMVAYALIIGRSGTGRLRADQAGDNCYYLGLIYTLASLAHAIFTFDPDDTAGTIVQGFGIALATTILGLVLRVFFNQGRPDLENIEQQVRLEFSEATAKLKGELNIVVLSVNDLSRQLQQSLQEIHTSASTTMTTFATQTVAEVQAVTASATAVIDTQAQAFSARSEQHVASMDRVIASLEQHARSVEALSESHHALAGVVRNIRKAADTTSATVTALQQGMETVQPVLASTRAVHTLTGEVVQNIRQLETQVQRLVEQLNSQLTQINRVPLKSATDLAQAAERIYQSLAQQGEAALTLSRNHNEALSTQLSQSRALVAKVHSALVDMTESIAQQAEGRS